MFECELRVFQVPAQITKEGKSNIAFRKPPMTVHLFKSVEIFSGENHTQRAGMGLLINPNVGMACG